MNKVQLNYLLLIMQWSLFILFIVAWVNVIIDYYTIKNWEIWTIYFLLVNASIVIIWKFISKWMKGLNNENKKMIGKKLEFFFFIFLFLSTYTLCFIIARVSLILFSNLFSISIISALFCGWLHYCQEINKPESKNGWKYEHLVPQSIYFILVMIFFSVLLASFFYFFYQ